MNVCALNLNKIATTNCAKEVIDAVVNPVGGLVADTISFSANALSKGFTKLSQEVSHRFSDKGYRVVSLPKGMEIVEDGFKVTKKVPTVAIVDIFSDSANFKIGPRTKAHHGDIVTKYAVKGLEDKVGVLAFDITRAGKARNMHVALEDALLDLVDLQTKEQNIKALNLSVGENYTYNELNEYFNLNLSAKNIEKEKEKLLELLKTSKDERHQQAYRCIEAINKMVNRGVKVYVASGNTGDSGLDLFSLSKAQNIVSAHDYSLANKTLSTAYSKGTHEFTSYYDKKGNLTRVTDGIIEFTPDEVETKRSLLTRFIQEEKFELKGTSYSSPAKLNEDLKLMF